MFYAGTIAEIRKAMRRAYPGVAPDQNGLKTGYYSGYVCWMLDEIEKFPTNDLAASYKAARWIGWVLGVVETQLALWKNDRSRELIRADVKQGLDRPH